MKYLLNKQLVTSVALSVFMAIVFPAMISAQEKTATEIIHEIEVKEKSAGSRVIMSMNVYSDMKQASNVKSYRLMMLSRGDDDTYVEIIEPKAVKGLRVLSLGRDNWLFFPSTGRVRKIAGSSRGDSVQGIGGDFSYEDLGGGAWGETYSFTIVSSNPDIYRLHGIAREADAVYSEVDLTVSRIHMLPVKVEYSTNKDGRIKELEFSNFTDFGGKTAAGTMEMRNLKKNSKTIITIVEADYGSVPDERYFNPNRFYR